MKCGDVDFKSVVPVPDYGYSLNPGDHCVISEAPENHLIMVMNDCDCPVFVTAWMGGSVGYNGTTISVMNFPSRKKEEVMP